MKMTGTKATPEETQAMRDNHQRELQAEAVIAARRQQSMPPAVTCNNCGFTYYEVSGGVHVCNEYRKGETKMIERYYLKADHELEWSSVTRKQFIAAEQAAGFRSKFGPNHPATSGFTGRGMQGRVEYVSEAIATEHEPAARGEGERWRIDPHSSCEVIVDDDTRPAYLANRIATFYGDTKEQRAQRAEQAVEQHNSRTALVEQRDRLREALLMFKVPTTDCWCSDDPRIFDHSARCQIVRAALNEQKGGE